MNSFACSQIAQLFLGLHAEQREQVGKQSFWRVQIESCYNLFLAPKSSGLILDSADVLSKKVPFLHSHLPDHNCPLRL